MRIFVTGGTGFFGKSIADYISAHEKSRWKECEFVVLSRRVRTNEGNVSYVQGNICDFDFPNGHFDAIIHMASPIQGALPELEMEQEILSGTRRIISFAKYAKVERVLFTSSGAVYGSSSQSKRETDICKPENGYGAAKLASERMFIEAGLDVKIARCFAFVGKRLPRRGCFAIGNFIQDCVENKTIIIKGDGTPLRSYLYADDLAEWLLTILDRGISGRPYNVGSEYSLSIRDLAVRVRSVLGTTNKIEICTAPSSFPPSVYVPDVSRAKKELGLKVRVDIDNAIRLSL